MVGELLPASSTDSNDDASGVSLTPASFPGVAATVAVVVQHVPHIASLKHRTACVSNQLLHLVEQQMVELLPRQGVARFEALDVFFRQRHTNVVSFGRGEHDAGHSKVRRGFQRLLHAQIFDVTQGFSTHGVAADLVARPGFFLNEENSLSFHGQITRCG